MNVATVDWLLAAKTPSIAYLAERDLRGLSPRSPRALELRNRIMQTGPVPAILARQSPAGSWKGERSYYTPKYTSTHWSLLLLAEHEAAGDDPRFGSGVDFMLAATEGEARRQAATGVGAGQWDCFWGNLLRYALRTLPAENESLGRIMRILSEGILADEGRCSHNDGRPCVWGIARAMWGLAAIPPAAQSAKVRKALGQGTAFLLTAGHLQKGDYPTRPGGRIHAVWKTLNFPLFYQADTLFLLRMMDELHALGRPEVAPALDWLAGRRKANGRWHGTSPFRSRTWKALGDGEETDRWVTLQAMRVLRHAGRLTLPGG
jgi:hypothetical protein